MEARKLEEWTGWQKDGGVRAGMRDIERKGKGQD